MAVKLLFSWPDGKVLEAQIVGYDGVDKRIDVISTAIRSRLTVFDLERLEFAYAPMYSSAKDPVNIAGYTAANILKRDCPIFHWNEIAQIDSTASVLLDVRTEYYFQQGSIPGAVNIPVDSLRDRLHELPREKTFYVYCQVGLRGYIALRILTQHGFAKVKNLSAG
jgi:rhodanese-related sulfurtransferase